MGMMVAAKKVSTFRALEIQEGVEADGAGAILYHIP